MFRRGMLNGLNGVIPVGGHNCPSSILGDREAWKKAQKKEMKNMISEVINKIIPSRIPLWTGIEWDPENVASRTISRHHIYIQVRVGGIVNK